MWWGVDLVLCLMKLSKTQICCFLVLFVSQIYVAQNIMVISDQFDALSTGIMLALSISDFTFHLISDSQVWQCSVPVLSQSRIHFSRN